MSKARPLEKPELPSTATALPYSQGAICKTLSQVVLLDLLQKIAQGNMECCLKLLAINSNSLLIVIHMHMPVSASPEFLLKLLL